MEVDRIKVSSCDIDQIDISSVAEKLVLTFAKKGKTLASAESCTGGMFGSSVTAVSGASAVYLGGVISYVNDVKEKILGVSAKTLEMYTAVSEFTACEMARGARMALGSDISVSVTGYAGPTGGDEKNPVGTVYICIADKENEYVARLSFDSGITRSSIREYAVYFMLSELSKRV